MALYGLNKYSHGSNLQSEALGAKHTHLCALLLGVLF